jgi:PAS domain S-box-containing protein
MGIIEQEQRGERLELQKAYLQQLFDISPGAIVLLDTGDRVVQANRGFETLFGYSNQEIKGRWINELIIPEDRIEEASILSQASSNGEVVRKETIRRRKDGSLVDVFVIGYPIRFDGKLVGIYVIYSDITERKQAEDLYNTLVKNSPVGIYIYQDGKYHFVNPQFQKVTGYSEDKLLDISPWELVHPEDRTRAKQSAVQMLKGISSSPYEFRVIDPNGRTRWAVETVSSINYNGKRATLGYFMDITERKQSEDRIRQAAEEWRRTFDSTIDAISIHSEDYRILRVNKAFANIFNMEPRQLIGKYCYELMHCTNGPMPGCPHQQTLISKKPAAIEYYEPHLKIFLQLSTSPVFDEKGEVISSVHISRDITKRKQAEEALRESEQRFSVAFHSSPDIIAITTIKDGRYVDINDNYSRFTGYSREELIGRCTRDINIWASVEDRDRMSRILEEQGKIANEEFNFRMKSGEIRTWRLSAEPIIVSGEECLIGVSIDITDQKKSQQLQQSENHVLHLLGQGAGLSEILEAIIRLGEQYDPDIKGSILLFDNSKEILTLASAPSLPSEYTELLENGLPIGPKMGSCGTAAYLKERVIVPDIKNSPLFRSSDEVVDCAINNGLLASFSQPIISSKGALLGTIANYSNKVGEPNADNLRILEWSAHIAAIAIEHKQAEKALSENEERYRSLVSNISLGIFRSTPGPRGKFLEINPAMERITGYSRKELLRMDIVDLYRHPEERQAVLKEVTSANGASTRELYIRKKDGTEIIVSDTKVAVRDTTGQVIYFDGIMEDITERKKMQEQLIMQDRLASIGELASGTAHELNNPLTSVIGFSQLLMERDIPADIKEDLNLICSEAQRAANVIKNLLTFARKHTPVKQSSQINGIIEDVLRLRAYEQKVNNIEIKKQLDANLPEIMVDYFQMQQVFLNIVVNAEYFMIEAHNKGTLIISTERLDRIIRISITDDGPGISQENQSRIFDPFFTTKEVGRGTGLGLSICHGVVTEHGGRIFATSQTGKGATFVVELPIKGNQV